MHQRHTEKDKASVFYAGQPPWDELGTRLSQPATALEAMAAARLNWLVAKVSREDSECAGEASQEETSTHLLVKLAPGSERDGTVLGYVTESFVPLQNCEAFRFFDPVVGQGAATLHSAGALGKGELVWLLAQLPGEIRLGRDDVVRKYLLLCHSHTGRGGIEIRFTPLRLLCANTLIMALSMSRGIRADHREDVFYRLRDASLNIALLGKRYQEIENAFRAMSGRALNAQALSAYLEEVFAAPSNLEDEVGLKRAHQWRALATELFDNMPDLSHSLWSAYNSVAELLDHRIPYASAEERMRSTLLGENAALKVRAYELALRLITNSNRPCRQSACLG